MTDQYRQKILASAFVLAVCNAGLAQSVHAATEQKAWNRVAKAIQLHKDGKDTKPNDFKCIQRHEAISWLPSSDLD